MALGVLNNLSAIYAENNLNNTSASLQTVLQQLSSGSKINSGADDAAGLSLVNGLEANRTALMQSETNATEGVGLLDVADGALSQVTSLLDRAITLATEASNGTLNSMQESAANQEYQSILSEINNIGSTTTYNQQAVFSGQTISIYTGDSSTEGSSVDNLNIRTLSEASVGDTGGTMSYSSGENNVFLNLSNGSANASGGDTLNASGATTIDVTYLVKGSTGAATTATTSISVGTGTTFANTVDGLISAINNSGLGLTATLASQEESGVTGGGYQTGIQIAGGLVAVGADPNSVSTSGTLNAGGITADALLTPGQTITVSVGGKTVGSPITIGPSINTLAEVAGTINGWSGAPVKASVITNGDGTQSLALTETAGATGALTVSATAGTGTAAPSFGTATVAKSAPVLATTSGATTGTASVTAVDGSTTFGINGTNVGTDLLATGGSIMLTNTLAAGTQSMTFVVGAGTDTGSTVYTANHGDHSNSLSNLAATIQGYSALGVTASVGASGITVASTTAATGDNVTASGNTLENANAVLSLYNPTDGGAASTGTDTVTAIDAGAASGEDDVLSTGGTITLSNGNAANNLVFTATAGQTYADLAVAIDGSNLGVVASWSAADHALLLTSNTTGAPAITVTQGGTLLKDTSLGGTPNVSVDAANAGAVTGVAGSAGTYGTAILQLVGGTIADNTATLTGQIQIKNGSGPTQTFIMGANTTGNPAPAGTVYTNGTSVASLLAAINGDVALGVNAMAPGGGTGGIYLQSTTVGTSITTPGTTTLADAIAENNATSTQGKTGLAGADSTLTVGLASGSLNTSDTLTTGGSISLTNNGVTHTFTVGSGSAANTTYLAAGSTLADMAAAISASALGLTAQANTSGLTLTSASPQNTGITLNASTLSDATEGTYSTDALGSFASESDTVTGTLSFNLNGSTKSLAVTPGSTVEQMIEQINNANLGVQASWVPTTNGYGNVLLTANAEGSAGQIGTATASLADTTPTAALSYTASVGYSVGLTSDTTDVVYDSTTGQNATTNAATFTSDAKTGSGAATMSYADGAGESLAGTNLLSQSSAQTALTDLNLAISDVAAQDGYIGAQINTLNSISQVMTRSRRTWCRRKNAIQATDYASATSNMSKYEILSQTGIAALAQANTVQQEVTKLLQ